jgi:hypothetical protein
MYSFYGIVATLYVWNSKDLGKNSWHLFLLIFILLAETRREDTLTVIKYEYSGPFLFISTLTDQIMLYLSDITSELYTVSVL